MPPFLTVNPTSYSELTQLADEVFKLAEDPVPSEELERKTAMACNALMDGDAAWTFTTGHKPALRFISQLLTLRAMELRSIAPEHRPDYYKDE
jgi:hypothetical protein